MAVSLRHSLICCGLMPGGASSTAMRLAWPSQWLISASCTVFHMPRSIVPSSWVAAVTRSGTMTMVTSSAMVRPLIPVRADSEPAKARPGTATGVGSAGSIANDPVGIVCRSAASWSTSILVSTFTLVEVPLIAASMPPSVTPEKTSGSSWPSVMVTSKVGGASSSAPSAAGSGVMFTETSAFGSSVVNG